MTLPHPEPQYDLAGNEIVSPTETPTPELSADPVPEQPTGGPLDEEWSDDTWMTLSTTLPDSVPDEHIPTASLEQYVAQANQLNALYHTVQLDGVSQEDMRTLTHLNSALTDAPTTPGLEAFSLLRYTTVRSDLSHAIACESFAQSLIQTIKAWINRLVDFIGRCIEWTVRNLLGEGKYTLTFNRRLKSYDRVRKARVDLNRLLPQASLTEAMDAYAMDLMTSDGLVYSKAFAAALGGQAPQRMIEKSRKDTVDSAAKVSEEITKLKGELQKNTPALSIDRAPLTQITQTRAVLEAATLHDEDTYKVLQVRPGEYFNKVIPAETKIVTPFESVVSEYHVMRRRLKDIKKITREVKLAEVVAFMNDVSTCVTDLNVIINALKTINDTKLQVIGLFINYENYYVNKLVQTTRQAGKEATTPSKNDEAVEKILDNLRNFLKNE